jgi:hypothetical protein
LRVPGIWSKGRSAGMPEASFAQILPDYVPEDTEHFLKVCSAAIAERQQLLRARLSATVQQTLQGALRAFIAAQLPTSTCNAVVHVFIQVVSCHAALHILWARWPI